jgi:hypothetical protein|tara:strand:+ start:7214 stop:7414 length:201 start_codon:yes stop_codon:yes gene_type:complete
MKLNNEPEWVYPFEAMGAGESFFIPTMKSSQAIYAIESGAKRAKVKVKVYPSIKEGCMGVRCWRVL